jgi:radical SAM superfamily enzyme YgiQ (UPF0313 family)
MPSSPAATQPRRDVPNHAHPVMRAEYGTIYTRAPRELVLCYPNSYRVAGASLGLQVVYRILNSRAATSCQRAVAWVGSEGEDDGGPVRSLEHGMTLDRFAVVLFSVAYELDIPRLVDMLERSGVPPLRTERGPDDPLVIVGGPLTQSNALPLGHFADAVVMGEAEHALQTLLDVLESDPDAAALAAALCDEPGFWVPAKHHDAVPDVLSVRGDAIPARGQWRSGEAEFRDMMLLETSRGCPRYCGFCVVRAPASPMRSPELERVVAALDEPAYRDAPRVGFVGAAVSDWPFIKDALRAAVERGKGVGISSLRADRLDEEFVGLLRDGGYKTLTVASDAASQRLRGKMMKGLRERHFLAAAELARAAGLSQLKLYVILGLPDETDADLDELVDLCQRLSRRVRLAITISPFVPKLHTPLADAAFTPIKEQMRRLKRVQRALGRRVDVRFDSPRQAWIEYRLSQGGMETGLAAWAAWREGGRFADWRSAFKAIDADHPEEERAAGRAALAHDLWPLTGAR